VPKGLILLFPQPVTEVSRIMTLAAETNCQPVSLQAGCMALVKAVERLAAADSLEDIIEIVRTTARDISGADGVTFVLRDGDLCHYVEEDAIGPLWKGKRFPLTSCISGWCMLNDRPAVSPDIYDDERIPQDAYRPTFVKSLVMVPVRTSEPIAAIGSYWAKARDFSKTEVEVLEALGRSTAAAIAAVRLRETLRDRENRLAMALDAGGLGAWDLDLVTGNFNATKACKAVFGREPEAYFSLNSLLRAIHPDDRAEARKVFDAGPGPDMDKEYRVVLQDGREKRIELRGRAVPDANGKPCRMTGVVRDVSERFLAKERLDRARAELARVGRMNDLGQMASALAHELNQPLTAAANYMHAAERMLDKDAGQALAAIGKAESQFERAKTIIQRTRDFVGKGRSARTQEDVRAVIAEVLELARTAPRHRIFPVRIEMEPGLPPAEIDKVQIQQVLLNLLRNAFEAMEGCYTCQVVIAVKRGEAPGTLEVCVKDSGPGLAAEIAGHLFEPFRTTKESGMGVGLSLCRKIVELHGGRLWHEPGTPGATFCFTVPAAE